MKLNREKLLKDYLEEISRICDLEEMEFKTSFSPEEIVDIICNLIGGGHCYGREYTEGLYFEGQDLKLEKIKELEQKLNSKYDESISAILDWVYHNELTEEYNKVHDTLFKYKSKILNETH